MPSEGETHSFVCTLGSGTASISQKWCGSKSRTIFFYAALRAGATASTSAWRLITFVVLSFTTLSFSFHCFTSCQNLSSPVCAAADHGKPSAAMQGESNALAEYYEGTKPHGLLAITLRCKRTLCPMATRKPVRTDSNA